MLIVLGRAWVCGMFNICSFSPTSLLVNQYCNLRSYTEIHCPILIATRQGFTYHAITLDENYSFKGSEV